MSWTDIMSKWAEPWSNLYTQAQSVYKSSIEQNASQYLREAHGLLRELGLIGNHLSHIQSLLKHPAVTDADISRYNQIVDRHRSLSAGLYSNAKPITETEVGVAPLLVVGGLMIGAAGISWSIAAYEYAVNLREQTALFDRELTERIRASEDGRVLQSSTIPGSQSDDSPSKWVKLAMLGGFGAAAAAIAIPIFRSRRAA